MDTALTHRVGAHADRLLYYVAVIENQVLPVELLQETRVSLTLGAMVQGSSLSLGLGSVEVAWQKEKQPQGLSVI